jgi:RNA polymerase-binding transcription factor DksA
MAEKPAGSAEPGTDEVEQALRARAEELERLRQFAAGTSFDGDQREAFDELSVVDQHPADVADQTYQRVFDATIAKLVDEEEQQVREALARKAAGTYGICENCGRPIDPARLKARPEATLCIDCQREREAGH